MASRASRLSSSSCGLPGELSPLNSELLAKGLMPNQPTSIFFMAPHRPDSSSITLVLAVYGVQMTSICCGYFSMSILMWGRWWDEMPVKRARPLFLAQSRALATSSISPSLCWMLCSWQVMRHRST